MSQPIFTIDARGNIMLEVIRSYFELDQAQMHREIRASFAGLLDILHAKGIVTRLVKNASGVGGRTTGLPARVVRERERWRCVSRVNQPTRKSGQLGTAGSGDT